MEILGPHQHVYANESQFLAMDSSDGMLFSINFQLYPRILLDARSRYLEKVYAHFFMI